MAGGAEGAYCQVAEAGEDLGGGAGAELGSVFVVGDVVICPAFFGPSDCVLLTLLPASLPTL